MVGFSRVAPRTFIFQGDGEYDPMLFRVFSCDGPIALEDGASCKMCGACIQHITIAAPLVPAGIVFVYVRRL